MCRLIRCTLFHDINHISLHAHQYEIVAEIWLKYVKDSVKRQSISQLFNDFFVLKIEDNQLVIFSSPEHNVLRGSYCDRSSSGVRPSVRLSVRPSVRPTVRPLTISLKIFSSKTRRPILIKLGRNVPWVKLYKNC